jgi:copper chaperone CopZ
MANSKTLAIEGMHCDACVRRVRAALAGVDGVEVKNVRVGSADIETPDSGSNVEDAIYAINNIGFTAHVDKG